MAVGAHGGECGAAGTCGTCGTCGTAGFHTRTHTHLLVELPQEGDARRQHRGGRSRCALRCRSPGGYVERVDEVRVVVIHNLFVQAGKGRSHMVRVDWTQGLEFRVLVG
eukprot:357118-Chlamydomonas_euryale.AAC.1